MRRLAHHHRRFTLVELLIVLLILAAVAASAASMVGEADEQFRFEETRARLERIRRGVIGGADGTPGQPAGFVADLGRLPSSLQELLEQGALPAYQVDAQQVGRGWRGPYVHATPNLSGVRELYDGWGNTHTDTPAPGDAANYGWVVSLPGANTLSVVSLGRDRAVGGTQPYDQDYPAAPLVTQPDAFVDLDALTITLQSEGAALTNETLRLRVHLGTDDPGGPGETSVDLTSQDLPSVDVAAGGSAAVTFSFPAASRWAPWGARTVEVQRDNAGTWEPLGGGAPLRVVLRPRATHAITWRIP